MHFIYPKKNILLNNKYFIVAITIYVNGCAHTNDVTRMESEKHTNEEMYAYSFLSNPKSSTISNLLIGCGLSEEDIECILPNDQNTDPINQVFEQMKICKEHELDLTNTSYLLLKMFEGLSNIDHYTYIKGMEKTPDIEKDINTFTNVIHKICSKGFDINEAHLEAERCAQRVNFTRESQNTIFEYGNNLLMSIISSGRDNSSMPALLLLSKEVGANPFMTDNDQKNALHFLLLKGHIEQTDIVNAILDRQDMAEHINDVTIYGDTAMHIACLRRDEKWILQLLKKGAKLDIENKDKKRPIDLLRLDKKERLGFLCKYLTFSSELKNDLKEKDLKEEDLKEEDLKEVATIDKTFYSDPDAIEKNIHAQSL